MDDPSFKTHVSTCCVLKSAVEAAAAIWAGDGKLISRASLKTMMALTDSLRMAMALAASCMALKLSN